MAGKRLQIEIGERLIKVCETDSRKKGWGLLESFMLPTPAGAVADGQIQQPADVAKTLQEGLAERGIQAKTVAFTISSGKIAAREVMLPPVKDSRLAEVVAANAADYFPVDLSKYHVTYTLLERIAKGEDAGCRLLVLAAPISVLEGYFRVAEFAGLQISTIDYSVNSQYRALETENAEEGVVMYVHVDTNASNVLFMRGRDLMLQRSFSYGGDDLILTYIDATQKEDYLEALEELVAEDSGVRQWLFARDLNEDFSAMLGSLKRSIDYFNSNNWQTPVEKIILVGPCSRICNLKKLVGKATGIKTAFLEEQEGFSGSLEAIQTLSEYLSCLGNTVRPVDFIPEVLSKTKKKEAQAAKSDSLKIGVIALAGCLVIAGALCGVGYLNNESAKQEKETMSKRIEELTPAEEVYNTFLAYQKGVTDLETLAQAVDSPNDDLVEFIGELEKKMPSQIRVLSAVCTAETISMNVVVGTKDEAAAVIVSLRTFESLSSVDVKAISEAKNESGVKEVSFSVTCAYGQNPYLASGN